MVREIERPWADLQPELLSLIYEKLPPVAAFRSSGFGSVCKPWRQFHAAVPLPPPDHHPHLLISPTVVDAAIPDEIRNELQTAAIVYSWPSSGWLLLRHSRSGQIFSCFNPLFSWPQNYMKLPTGLFAITPRPAATDPNSPPLQRISAAFSSDPTSGSSEDCTILVIGAQDRTFSTFRRGDSAWKNYYHYHAWHDSREIIDCVGIGFREGKFFCLFETRYLLIFGIDGGAAERRMLEAVSSPTPAPAGQVYNNLQIVERGRRGDDDDGSCVVVNWERVADGGRQRWRLARVERRRKEEGMVAEVMEEGRRRDLRVVVFRENRQYKIWPIWKDRLVGICTLLSVVGFALPYTWFWFTYGGRSRTQ